MFAILLAIFRQLSSKKNSAQLTDTKYAQCTLDPRGPQSAGQGKPAEISDRKKM